MSLLKAAAANISETSGFSSLFLAFLFLLSAENIFKIIADLFFFELIQLVNLLEMLFLSLIN